MRNGTCWYFRAREWSSERGDAQNLRFPIGKAHISGDTASVLTLRFGKPTLFHQEYARFQSCCVPLCFWRISCTAPGGTRGARRGRSPGRRFSIQKGRSGRPVLSPQLPPPGASLKARTAAATQREHANLAASAGKPALSEMRRSNASSHYCELSLSQPESDRFCTAHLSLPKLVACRAGRGTLPAANNCHFPNKETDISENSALALPVPLCEHATFSARRS